MYQLSHLLTEQRSLIVSLLDNSIMGDKAPGLRGHVVDPKPEQIKTKFAPDEDAFQVDNQEGRKRLTALLEKVEGCAVRRKISLYIHQLELPKPQIELQNVVESATRTLIHEGDMVELDPADNCAIGRVRGFLLNDSFMIASWLPNKYDPKLVSH